MVITPDGTVATPTNAGRHEVNLDGISVIVSAPEGSFDREVFLKASRVDDNEDIKRLLSKNLNIDTDSKGTLTESEDKESENTEENIDNVETSATEEPFTDEESSNSDVTEGEEYVDSTISLDIHFEDESGSEVEPLKQVYVNIKLDSGLIPKGINPEDVQIYHIKDDESISKVDDIALTKDKDDDSITTNFSTDSFSTFTLSWRQIIAKFEVKIKYVDTNGNEIAADLTKLGDLYNSGGRFNNPNDKITPRELDTGIVGMRYKYARAIMSNGTVVNNILQIERETSLSMSTGMRYTIDGTNWVNFGTNDMRYLELVYEPESRTISNRRIRTDISKTVEDPDKDGIYDLTLTINNQTGSTTNRTNMDVLFLLDTTSSMSEGISGRGTDPKISSVYSVLGNVIRNNYFDSSKYNVNYALVGIDTDPHLYQNWTNNGNTLISKIPVSPNNVSRINYEKGFVKANEIFRNGRSDAQKVLIFITDSDPDYFTNHSNNRDQAGFMSMRVLHAQFALYAIDLDYFFPIGLGNQNNYENLKYLVNSKESNSPIENYNGITLPAPGVEVGASPYSAGSKNDFLNRMREIVNVLKNPKVSNVVVEDKLSQYAMIAKDPSGNPYPLEIEVLGPTGIHTGNYIATNMYRLFSTPRNSLADIVSSYNASTKTIRLEFPYAYTLETGYTYMIKAKIQTTQQANAIYSSTGHFQKNSNGSDVVGDPGTGSKSSNQKGFYSNDLATLTYKYKDKEIVETFKKPVIQPYINPVPTGVSFKMTYAIIFISASIFSVLIFFFRRKRD
jgi:hypothetical protein